MANVITNIPAQATERYELYLKPFLDDPQINALPFDIMVGKFKSFELYFNTQLDKVGYKKVSCGWDYKTGFEFTKKTVTPIELALPIEQCYDEVVNTIFANGLPDGWERGMLSPEIVNLLIDMQKYAFNRDLLSKFWLGDTASANGYYDDLDGFYKKLAEGVSNADGTVDAGAVTATDINTTNFFTTLKAIYDAQSRFLKQIPKERKVWVWTEAVYDAYLAYLYVSTQTNAGAIQRETIEAGLESAKFMGIPIHVAKIVDQRLEEDFTTGSPAVTEDPYRIVLTNPTNHKIVLDGSGFMNQNTWYSDDDDVYRVAGSALLAYEYGYGDQNVVAGLTI